LTCEIVGSGSPALSSTGTSRSAANCSVIAAPLCFGRNVHRAWPHCYFVSTE
jgi:hypothetical protein